MPGFCRRVAVTAGPAVADRAFRYVRRSAIANPTFALRSRTKSPYMIPGVRGSRRAASAFAMRRSARNFASQIWRGRSSAGRCQSVLSVMQWRSLTQRRLEFPAMRLPRLQFRVRTLMIGVAVVAVALLIVIPATSRLIWLYNTPGSVNLIAGTVVYRPIRSLRQHTAGKPANRTFPVGQPVPAQCSYQCSMSRIIPGGLLYRATVVANLMDAKTWTVLESHKENHILIAGLGSWKAMRGTFSCNLTPTRPEYFMVQYEINVTDLFGRKNRAALHTDGFQAQ